jgi:serine/threonine protein kinase/ankyrin repeat protein
MFRRWYGCVADAIAYLKEVQVRHNDIKPENILIKGKNIFITDFGTAWDWSDRDRADSVTKGAVEALTPRYASPEVFMSGSRRSSSDVWSLGVVFLEMTTVLRGKTIRSLENYLTTHGSKVPYVSQNPVAANNWLSELRPGFPRSDNEPIQWIIEMIKEEPTARPLAKDIRSQIAEAANRAWIGHCCNEDDSTESFCSSLEEEEEEEQGDTQSDKGKGSSEDLDPTIVPLPSAPPIPIGSGLLTTPASPQAHVPVIKTRSKLEGPLSPGETIGQRMMEKFLGSLPEIVCNDNRQGQVPFKLYSEISPEQDLGKAVPAEPQYQLKSEQPSQIFHSLEMKHSDVEGLDASRQENEQKHEAKNGASTDSNVQVESRQLPEIPKPDYLSIMAEKIMILAGRRTIPTTILDTWQVWGQEIYSRPMTPKPKPDERGVLVPTRSYEDLTRQTESLLQDTRFDTCHSWGGSDDITLITHPDDVEYDLDEAKQELRSFELKLSWTPEPEITHENTVEPEISNNSSSPEINPTAFEAANKNPAEQETVDISLKPKFTPPIPGAAKETHVEPKKPNKPKKSSSPETASTGPPKLDSSTSAPENPLKASLDRARGKPSAAPPAELTFANISALEELGPALKKAKPPRSSARLTSANLISLNKDVKKSDAPAPKRVKVSLKTASIYMKSVLDDAASSVATSKVSTRTRNRFKLAGLMLPLQDRSVHYMEQFTKEGKASTVRLLLESGCNPGTKRDPRPGPIFNAVRGATERHTKCVRALIDSGVNLNARYKSNKRTPLHYAIEHEEWKGYSNLIYILLAGGADPNLKDATGDVPLLQILYGGVEPLAEYKRNALALLLAPNYDTDVTVCHPATRNTPLHLAVLHKDPWAVALLLERDVEVNKKNITGLTPLQLASGSWGSPMSDDQIEILELLLEKKANVNVRDAGTGQTPLHVAVSLSLHRVAERLVKHGGDVNQKDQNGKTPRDLFEEHKAKNKTCKRCARIQPLFRKTLVEEKE